MWHILPKLVLYNFIQHNFPPTIPPPHDFIKSKCTNEYNQWIHKWISSRDTSFIDILVNKHERRWTLKKIILRYKEVMKAKWKKVEWWVGSTGLHAGLLSRAQFQYFPYLQSVISLTMENNKRHIISMPSVLKKNTGP